MSRSLWSLIFVGCLFCLSAGCADDDPPGGHPSNSSEPDGSSCGDRACEDGQDADSGRDGADESDADVSCSQDADCEESVCDPVSNRCVECLESSHCLSDAPVCIDRQCMECETEQDCDGGAQCVDHMCTEDCDEICEAPTGLDVPFAVAQEEPYHWPFDYGDGCIELTYNLQVADHVEKFEAAVNAWTSLECNQLCVGTDASQGDNPFDAEPEPDKRQIYLGEDSFGGDGSDEPVSLYYLSEEESRGKFRAIVIDLEDGFEALSESEQERVLVQYAGFAFGLNFADSSVESVVAEGSDLSEPTEADEESFCTMYGENPHCGCR